MSSEFKIQGHTRSQQEYDQMMDIFSVHASSLVPIQTLITITPTTTQEVASSQQEATCLEITIIPQDTASPKDTRMTSCWTVGTSQTVFLTSLKM